ncbi:MAG: S-layer homology domain-containing protein [Firmicutes bacterium]|nr:S-layer homology domain-containing protein [Bacillota bacterium]
MNGKKKLALLGFAALLVLAFALFPASALGAGVSYADVRSGDWYYDSVQYVSDQGLMTGVGGGSFDPQGDVTRGMIVTVIYRMEGKPAVTGRHIPFTDVAPGSWYAAGVTWAAAKGIVSGYSEDRFGPEDRISREQLAAVCYRYAQYKGYDVSGKADISAFADASAVHSWAKDAVAWANAAGLVNGVGGNALDPQGRSTRAQAAAILMRFETNVAGKPAPEPTPQPQPDTVPLSEVYAAYLAIVQANRSTLDIEHEAYSLATQTFYKERRKTVAVLDVWGNDLPELILGGCKDTANRYDPLEPLQIYTYQNGKAVKLYERTVTCRYKEYEMLDYVLLQKAGGKELYLREGLGHEAFTYTWYRLPSAGTVYEEVVAVKEYYPKMAGPDKEGNHYYNSNGTPMSESEYQAFEAGCQNSNNAFIFVETPGYPESNVAMIYADAVVFLGGKAPEPAGNLIDSYLVQSGIEVYNSPWKEVLPKEPTGACNYIAVSKSGGSYYVSLWFYRLDGDDDIPLDYDQVTGTATFHNKSWSGKLEFSEGKITLTIFNAPYSKGVHVFSK